ncbi:MAG: discoidin domain-containing protein [Planctomycetota bacterium]
MKHANLRNFASNVLALPVLCLFLGAPTMLGQDNPSINSSKPKTIHQRKRRRSRKLWLQPLENRQLLAASLGTPDFIFPPDAGVIDLTNWSDDPALNANPAPGNNDTAALQAALDSLIPPDGAPNNTPTNINRILYLPAGEYKIDQQLTVPIRPSNRASVGAIIQGENRDDVVIKLEDNVDLDGSALLFQVLTADAFRNAVRDLTIDVGVGNPNAKGLTFVANNNGIVSNVNIKSSDPDHAGRVGLELGTGANGPLLVENVSVDGFDVGIRTAFQDASQTFEDISLSNQQVFGWVNEGDQNVFVRNLTSVNEVQAIHNGPNGTNLENSVFTLVDSTLQGVGDASNELAIYTEERLYARNVAVPGYGQAVRRVERNGFLQGNFSLDGDFIDEYWSGGATEGQASGGTHELFDASPDTSLGLEIKDVPDVPIDPNFENWASPTAFVTQNPDGTPSGVADDAFDDSLAIQAAIDSGATTLYFPFGRWVVDQTVQVGGNIERIHGMESSIGSLNGEGAFRINESSSETIVYERIGGFFADTVQIEHASDTTLVGRNLQGFAYVPTSDSPGDLFLYDVVQGHFEFRNQNVWARQLNTEGRADINDPDLPDQKILVDNANVWVLGLKIENEGTILRNTNQGNVELLGVYRNNNNPSDEDNPAFVTVDANTSVVNFDAATAASNAYALWVSETRDGDTRTSARFGGSLGHVYSGFDSQSLWDLRQEVIVDNQDPGVSLSGDWSETRSFPGGFLDDNALFSREADASATFTPDLPVDGEYEVVVRWMNNWGGQDHTNHGRDVPITVNHLGGSDTTTVNQQIDGGKWVSFGSFDFEAGPNGSVTVASDGSGRAVIADAVRFVLKSSNDEIPISPGFAIQPTTDVYSTDIYSGASYVFTEGQNVLANDVDATGRPLSVVAFEQGRGGAVSITENGDLSYEAFPFFTGWDRFEYTVSNGVHQTTATVQVFVEDALDENGVFQRERTVAELKEAASAPIENVRVVEYDGTGRASHLLGPGQIDDGFGVSGFKSHARNGDGIHFNGPENSTITLDLGGTYQLETSRLWNYNQQDESVFFTRRTGEGVTAIRILVDTDPDQNGTPDNFVLATTIDLAEATGRNDYSGQVFDLEGVEARFVKLELIGNRTTVDRSSLSGIEFRGALVAEATVTEIPNFLVSEESSRVNNDRPGGRTIGRGYNAEDNFHDANRSNNWQSAADDPTPQITYDLNDDYTLGSMRLWNVNHGPDLDRGAKTIDVYTSIDNVNFTLFDTINLARGTATFVDHGEVFDLAGVEARYVRLDITETHGATDGAGIAEVRFFGRQQVVLENEISVSEVNASSNTASADFLIDESGLTEDLLRHLDQGDTQYRSDRNDLTPTIDFELQRVAELSKLYIWNFASAGQTGFNFDRGVRTMRVLTSENGVDYSDHGEFSVRRGFTSSQFEALNFDAPVRAKFVRFEVLNNHGDSQFTGLGEVKFFGTPVSQAPTIWNLDPDSDLGFSNTDGLTNLNNSSAANALSFRVGDVIPGDTVTLYADGVPIGSAVADAYLATITTDGMTTLADGIVNVTATRTVPGELTSEFSESVSIEIETQAPNVSIGQLGGGLELEALDIAFSEPIEGLDLSDLLLRAGDVPLSLENAVLEQTNETSYRLSGLGDLTDVAGDYSLSLAADGTDIVDVAGNAPTEFESPLSLVPRTRAFNSRNRDYSVIPHDDAFLLDQGEISLTFNTNNVNRGGLISKDHRDFGDGGHLMMRLRRGQVEVRLQSVNQSFYVRGGDLQPGVDYHVSFRFGNSGMVLAINGEIVATNNYTGGLGATSGGSGNVEDIVVGANKWKSQSGTNNNLRQFFTGRISDVRVADGTGNLVFSEAVTPYDFASGSANFFNGVDQFIEVTHTVDQELDSGAFELTFNTYDAAERQTLFSKDNTGFDGGGHLTASLINGRVEIRLQSTNRSYYLRSEAISSNTDYAMRFEFGSGGMKLFLNGELVDSDDYEGGLQGNDNSLIIAASQWRAREDADRLEYYFHGTISDFQMLDGNGIAIDLFGDDDDEDEEFA